MTASLPVNDANGNRLGLLNCIVLPPTIGRAKQYRKRNRVASGIADSFNAVLAERAALATQMQAASEADLPALEKDYDGLSAQLDDLDQKSYAALCDQAASTLQFASFTPADGAPQPDTPPTIKEIAWDDVEIPSVRAVNDFFTASINA